MPDELDPPTGEPVSHLTPEQVAIQKAIAEAIGGRFQAAQRGGRDHRAVGVRVLIDLNMMTAAAVCAAVNFMEQDVIGFEDEEAEAYAEGVASDLFHTLAVRIRDIILPVLANRGIATPPEMFMANVGAIETAIEEFNEESP